MGRVPVVRTLESLAAGKHAAVKSGVDGWKKTRKIAATVRDDNVNLMRLTEPNARAVTLVSTGHLQDCKLKVPRNRVTPALGGLPPSLQIALEMSLHSDDERRATAGELRELEQRWRDADAIAKIADGLLLPGDIDEHMNELRQQK